MSPTILIIDDFASVRLYHTSFLTRKGYHCLGAGDGEEALTLLRDHPVDLVVLDLVMPGMNGDTFLARLDTDPARAALPVLVITAEPELAEAIFSRGPRPVGVLAKPVMPAALLRGVEALLGRSPAAGPGG